MFLEAPIKGDNSLNAAVHLGKFVLF